MNIMCGESNLFSLQGVESVSNMLQDSISELLVASEVVKMNIIPSSKYP